MTSSRRRSQAPGFSVARGATLFATLASAVLGSAAHAEPELDWRGYIASDFRLLANDAPSFERLEGRADVRLGAHLSDHVGAVGNLRLIFTHRPEIADFGGLVDRTRLDPWRLESDALFVEFTDVLVDGLDLRLGRQQIIWGSADKFHPISNLNALDVEDPTLFGATLANQMISIAYQPSVTLGPEDAPTLDELSFQVVWVPFFKPARLPQSAGLGFTDHDVFSHRANTPLLKRLITQEDALISAGWTFTNDPKVVLPDETLDNSMVGARMGWKLLGIDMGFSYFYGFDDFPRAEKIETEIDVTDVTGTITLTYPRVHVLGFDAATSLDWLDGLGLWTEIGVTLHEDLYRVVATGPTIGINEIEKEHEAGAFVKAVVGIDYTPVEWLYLNVQYLHGFLDEFGASSLNDYLVAGADFKLATDRVLLRLFGIVDFADGSFVLYPQVTVKPWSAGEIVLGAFIYSSTFGGHDETKKFASRAAGSSTLFLKAKASF